MGQLDWLAEQTLREGIGNEGNARAGFSDKSDKLPRRGRRGRKPVGGWGGRKICGAATGCRRGRWKHRGEAKPGRGGERQGVGIQERQGGIQPGEIQGCWQAQASSGGRGLPVQEQQGSEQPGEAERREGAEGWL